MDKKETYEIGQSYIRFDFEPDEKFKIALKNYLLYRGKKYAKEIYNKEFVVDEFYFLVELDEGSLKSRLKIFGKLLIGSLLTYGGIRTGIDYVIQDSRQITEHIVQDLSNEPSISESTIGRVERRLGVPGKIKRLYKSIDRLNSERENLSPNQQQELIEYISKQYSNLVNSLAYPEQLYLEQDLREYNIPLQIPQDEERQFIYKEFSPALKEENELISEDEIRETTLLPPPEE